MLRLVEQSQLHRFSILGFGWQILFRQSLPKRDPSLHFTSSISSLDLFFWPSRDDTSSPLNARNLFCHLLRAGTSKASRPHARQSNLILHKFRFASLQASAAILASSTDLFRLLTFRITSSWPNFLGSCSICWAPCSRLTPFSWNHTCKQHPHSPVLDDLKSHCPRIPSRRSQRASR